MSKECVSPTQSHATTWNGKAYFYCKPYLVWLNGLCLRLSGGGLGLSTVVPPSVQHWCRSMAHVQYLVSHLIWKISKGGENIQLHELCLQSGTNLCQLCLAPTCASFVWHQLVPALVSALSDTNVCLTAECLMLICLSFGCLHKNYTKVISSKCSKSNRA